MIETPEPEISLLGTGSWRDLLPSLPRPVFALGSNELYKVFVEGSGFTLPITGSKEPATGFFTTRFVSASNIREAKDLAVAAIEAEWKRSGREAACGPVTINIEEACVLGERFRLRSGSGFCFF